MKSFINFLVTISITGIMTIIILSCASKIFTPKWIDHKGNMMTFIMKGYYEEEKNSLEVLFTGNSDVYRGISPMVLYKEYGIASYNYVSAGQRSWIAYTMLEEALKYQNPKIILFNVDELYRDNQATKGNYSKVYDNLRLSTVKLKALLDPTYDKGRVEKMYHVLPILSYHSRYNELEEKDFKYAYHDWNNPTKGMDLIAKSVPYRSKKDYMEYTEEVEELAEVNINYLNKMVKTCKDKGIELILFEVPSPDSWNYARHNRINEYAEDNNLKFIDLNLYNKEIGLNWYKDTSDGGDHLNIYGAEKTSIFLGKYLVDNYNLKDIRNDKKYEKWEKQYKEYLKIKEAEIKLAQQ